jgi:hypothetical protein
MIEFFLLLFLICCICAINMDLCNLILIQLASFHNFILFGI